MINILANEDVDLNHKIVSMGHWIAKSSKNFSTYSSNPPAEIIF